MDDGGWGRATEATEVKEDESDFVASDDPGMATTVPE